MMLHPGILALLLGSVLTAAMLCYSAYGGLLIIRNWDLKSGSELQLDLERRTYLISTLMSYALGFQLLSLFLFIYTADTLSPLFIGAMCAAGSLKVNPYGYPALVLKIVSCLLAGLWLIVNYTDNKGYDYPLIRIKYWLLLGIAPVLLAETAIQGAYLLGLQPDIITSCCGLLFSTDADTVIADLLALPLPLAEGIFAVSVAFAAISGLYVYLTTRKSTVFAVASLLHLLVAIVALISFISIYIYELPTHHCPFCILHREYGYIGYFLYGALFAGGVAGMGTGVIHPFRSIASLSAAIPRLQKRLALISLAALFLFVLIAGYAVWVSNLSMKAY